MSKEAWQIVDGGLNVRLRLTPKAATDALGQPEQTAQGPALKARVRAVAENGRANAALEILLARALAVPRSAVAVTSGLRSRVKTVSIDGDARALLSRLDAHLLKSN